MPGKYSHGLVFSQQQYWAVINTPRPPSPKPPSPLNSRSHTPSTTASVHNPSNYAAKSSGFSRYLRLEPDPESEPSYTYTTPTHTSRPSFGLASSDASRFESISSQRSYPPLDRLRLESSFDSRIENLPLPPIQFEPTLSEPLHYETKPSYSLILESSPSERLPLEASSPPHRGNRRPSLHHKSSSVETRIYAPTSNTSRPPTQDGQDQFARGAHEPYPSPPLTHNRQHHSPISTPQEHQNCPSRPFKLELPHRTSTGPTRERQHEFSMESPESLLPPLSTGDRQEDLSSEIQCARVPSRTRSRRRSFIQRTLHPSFGSQKSFQSPSAREPQDYFSIETHGSHLTPGAAGDNQNVSSMKPSSALSTPFEYGQVRSPLDMQRLQSPPYAQDHQRRRSMGMRRFSSERRPQTAQESFRGRRQSIDSQTRLGGQHPPSLGHRHLSLDRSSQETQYCQRKSIDSKTAEERQPRPSSSSQQLSLEQFIQESEHIREPSRGSQISSPQSSPSYMGRLHSNTLAYAQRYTPKSTPIEHIPRPRRERTSKLPYSFASEHRILLPNRQGAYDNVLIETHGFPPERPPSPPATPDSSKICSLTPQTEESQRTNPPPPIPRRSARRGSLRLQSTLRSTSSSASLPTEPPRPKTSSVIDTQANRKKVTSQQSPTMSVSTRRSSINAAMSPQSVSFSNFSEVMTSPRRLSFSKPRHKDYVEYVDLESLPSEIDFNVLPYEDPNAGPAIFRATQLGLESPVSARYDDYNSGPALPHTTQPELGRPASYDRPVSSRASSFDSAAPPPIGLDRRISHAAVEPHQPSLPKKERRMSLLSILRATAAPKAVLYSEATQGNLPVPVCVSTSTPPSIPLLFPGYRGQFPPQHKTQDKNPNSGTAPAARPRLVARTGPPRSIARPYEAEKRRSWFMGDGADKTHGANQSVRKGELERILSNL